MHARRILPAHADLARVRHLGGDGARDERPEVRRDLAHRLDEDGKQLRRRDGEFFGYRLDLLALQADA